MTGRTFRIQKYMLWFKKICNFCENYDFIEKKNCEKVDFLLVTFKCLMAPLDAQQNFMQ